MVVMLIHNRGIMMRGKVTLARLRGVTVAPASHGVIQNPHGKPGNMTWCSRPLIPRHHVRDGWFSEIDCRQCMSRYERLMVEFMTELEKGAERA